MAWKVLISRSKLSKIFLFLVAFSSLNKKILVGVVRLTLTFKLFSEILLVSCCGAAYWGGNCAGSRGAAGGGRGSYDCWLSALINTIVS